MRYKNYRCESLYLAVIIAELNLESLVIIKLYALQ